MATRPRVLEEIAFEESAQAYLRSLPLEHFMESVAQSTQRKITVSSMDLVHLERPDIQTFSELLIQYRRAGQREILKVVPDNMTLVWAEPIQAEGSFDLPLQPCGPTCVMEYVSKSNRRKDYEDNLHRYERELKVPYYLLFVPDVQELTLYQQRGKKYRTVLPNEHGRYAIPELELEVALLDGWVRYWFRGQLLPLPADLQRELQATRKQLQRERRRANRAEQHAEQADQRAEHADQRAEQADQRAEQADQRAEQADQRAEQADQHAEQAEQRAEQADQRAETERQARLAAEQANAQLRAQLEQLGKRPRNHS